MANSANSEDGDQWQRDCGLLKESPIDQRARENDEYDAEEDIVQYAGLPFLAQPGEEARQYSHKLEAEEDDHQAADAAENLGEGADVLARQAG